METVARVLPTDMCRVVSFWYSFKFLGNLGEFKKKSNTFVDAWIS